VRLDRAARLLQRRALLKTTQPISAMAYSSGFSDYANFPRQFHKRFGHSPGRTPNAVTIIRKRTLAHKL
jgi:AraC-like DNA-binding protein